VLPAEFDQPLTVMEARALGVHQRALHRLVRAGLCRRTEDGRFHVVPGSAEMDLALAGLGPRAVISCESVAAFLGWPLPAPLTEVHLTVPRSSSRMTWPGAVVHSRGLAEDETCTFQGVRLTTPEVAALDLASTLPLQNAVVLLDAGLRKGNLSAKGLRKRLVRRRRVPGNAQAALAVRLSKRARQSPLESIFRVLVHLAGLPAPSEQLVVRRDGVFCGRADFAWPAARLLVEIDGYEFHKSLDSFIEDRRRQNALVLAGWRVLRFSAADLHKRPEDVVDEVRRALAA
jgi:very-short-patch-repair endonuclease